MGKILEDYMHLQGKYAALERVAKERRSGRMREGERV